MKKLSHPFALKYVTTYSSLDLIYFPLERFNEVECPVCGNEMLDKPSNATICGVEVVKQIVCSNKKCNSFGFREIDE